jgi:hypothetical protein
LWGFDSNALIVVTLSVHNGAHVFRYDGVQWIPDTQAPGTTLNAVWGATPNDVFVVGSGTGHYANNMWTTTVSGFWYGVSGGDGTAVAVGNPAPNNVIRFSGGAWAPDPTGTNYRLLDISVTGSTEFAVGRTNAGGAPVVLRREGSWTDLSTALPGDVSTLELNAVFAISPTDGLAPFRRTPELSRCAAIPVSALVVDRAHHVDG